MGHISKKAANRAAHSRYPALAFKLSAALLALALLAALAPPAASAASASIKAAADAAAYAPGDTVAVKFSISGNPGFWGAGFTIKYDPGAMALGDIQAGRLFEGGNFSANPLNGTVAFYGESLTADVRGDGELFTAVFTVNASAKPGAYTVTAELKDGLAKNFINAAGAALGADVTGCAVKVDAKNITAGSEWPEVLVSVDVPSETEHRTDPGTGKVTALVTIKPEEVPKSAWQAADKLKSYSGDAVAEVRVTAKDNPGVSVTEFYLTVADIRLIASYKNIVLTLSCRIADTTFDAPALEAIAEGRRDSEPVRVTISLVDTSSGGLAPAQKAVIDKNSASKAIALSVAVSNDPSNDFKSGKAAVRSPFAPPASCPAEDYDLLTAYHLDDNGEYTEMAGAKYDAGGGCLRFMTPHFSIFFFSEWINPFTDLSKADWYYKNAHYAYSYNIMRGVGGGKFGGTMAVTRAQGAAILRNLQGGPAEPADPPFKDVAAGAWYADAVTWAGSNGIAAGYANGKFGPNDVLTREQYATFLYCYSAWKGYGMGYVKSLREYADYLEVSASAYEPLLWATAHGLIGSTSVYALVLSPKGGVTRGQAAALTQRFIETKSVRTGLLPGSGGGGGAAAADAAPSVAGVEPSGLGAPVNGNVSVTFSGEMSPGAGTVKLNSMALSGGAWSNGGKTYTAPYSGLEHSAVYTVYISGFVGAAGAAAADDATHSFTTAAEGAKTVSVGAQAGMPIDGRGGSATYAITTANIGDGTYTPTLGNAPGGVSAGDVRLSGGAGTLAIAASASVQAGDYAITLSLGGAAPQRFTLTVAAPSPSTAGSSDASLKSLAVSGATLSPQFSPNTAMYTAEVDAAYTQATVSATANDAKATVSGAGAVNLGPGGGAATVTVTAENGATKTYTVVITRKSNAKYAYISVTDPGAHDGQRSIYFARQRIELQEGDNVFSLLQRTGLSIRYSGHSEYAGVYVEAINGFGEFDDGPLSGWMYKVNGIFPEYSSSLYTLNDGDEVEWLYTRNLGADIGGSNATGNG